VSEAPDTPTTYKAIYSERVRAEVRRLIAAVTTPDLAREVLAAFREFDRRLHIYPQFGEPLQALQAQGQIYLGTVGPLVMRYALYEERRLVMVVALPQLLQK
jgi:hypothetical protein